MTQIVGNKAESNENEIKKLQKENENLRILLKEALIEVQNLKETLKNYENPNDGYNKSWSMVTKILFLIAKENKPLRSSEIISLLKIREPLIVKKQNSLAKYLSAFLNTAMKHERLLPYKLKGVRGNFYCLPEWINENGELITEMRLKIY